MFEQMNNNKVHLEGRILTLPRLSHQVYDENFYEIDLEVPRLSESVDIIPITISEKLLSENSFDVGKTIAINGQFRSYNKQVDGKSKLVLTVFVRELTQAKVESNTNTIELVGFICKEPIYRTTPFKREICDVLVAVNRAYNKSDYLPCIAWGRNARFAKNLDVGEKVSIIGRIQSRGYEKKLENGDIQKRTAYEISIIKLNKFSSLDKVAEAPFNLISAQQTMDTTNYTGTN